MTYKYLYSINSPADLKALDRGEIDSLCSEIRAFLIDKVGKNGGHLASNLGVVELSVALHRIFDSPNDHIIFDVGHQSYVHKILTGRRDDFDTLRIPGGLSGFTSMRESIHDSFGAGHSSTSISAALGYAEADKLNCSDNYTVAVIGDGSYTGGMVHEAINNCKEDLKLIVIINENGMSISSNKGSFASYLSRVRASSRYRGLKRGTNSFLSKIPILGRGIKEFISIVKRILKKVFFVSNYFEDLGFYYIGPIDGNDYEKVERALEEAKATGKCVFVHLITKKGKGYCEAESYPEKYHTINTASDTQESFHSIFAKELINRALEDEKIVAVTAAMGTGTGIVEFEKAYPDRCYDVGIAEEHALTFSAGLAAAGFKPFVAIYSTFLQRGYDNLIHDIALQKLPVRILVDRAGISVADGATHHGIFDVSFLSSIPGFGIFAPATFDSLRSIIAYSENCSGPLAIRYANFGERKKIVQHHWNFSNDGLSYRFDFELNAIPKNIIITYGNIAERAIDAELILKEKNIECGIVLVERIKPYDILSAFIASIITPNMNILYVEEGIKNGGAAMITESKLTALGKLSGVHFEIFAIDDSFLLPDTICDIYDFAGLSAEKISKFFLD